MPPIRLALLLCDRLTPPISDEFGQYTEIFTRLLSQSLAQVSPETTFTLDGYDVVDKMEYPPDDIPYDGLLISGSRHTAHEDVDWINQLIAYVKRIIAEKPFLKIFGICFGHQIVARALGAVCVRNHVWEVAVTSLLLTPIGKAIFGADTLDIHQMHRDHVPTCPPGAHLLCWNDVSPNHGMVVFNPALAPLIDSNAPRVDLRSIHILTIQGHPEYTEQYMTTLLGVRVGILGEDMVRDGLLRARGIPGKHYPEGSANDGVTKVGRVIWGVLGIPQLERTKG